jgi:hypothetical protein
MSATYGLTPGEWVAAKQEMRAILIERSKAAGTITYGELVGRMQSVPLEPQGYALHHMLGDVSRAEEAAGRGMLTAIVVLQDNGMPGDGFFALARELGRDTSD